MSFTVTLRPSERPFSVERDEAMLAAAIRQGIGLPYGCRDGACGSCKSRLLEGRVIHGAHQLKALSLAEEEAGFILTCCATPQTDCVVEARSVPGAGVSPQPLPQQPAPQQQPAPPQPQQQQPAPAPPQNFFTSAWENSAKAVGDAGAAAAGGATGDASFAAPPAGWRRGCPENQ